MPEIDQITTNTETSDALVEINYYLQKAADALARSGGIMTGDIILPQNPTLALHAVTKQYVDAGDDHMNPIVAAIIFG